jgi:rhodanese-related sulfurtransferase
LGHLPDAVHLHVDGLERDAAARLPKKNDVILVYSKADKSSLAAAKILVKLGYTDVYDLGSMDYWPYDIQK